MPKVEQDVIIQTDQGLHARPAALFVQLAGKFDAEIVVRKGTDAVNGKSIMGILMLAAEKNTHLTICADGDDAQAAVEELTRFLTSHATA